MFNFLGRCAILPKTQTQIALLSSALEVAMSELTSLSSEKFKEECVAEFETEGFEAVRLKILSGGYASKAKLLRAVEWFVLKESVKQRNELIEFELRETRLLAVVEEALMLAQKANGEVEFIRLSVSEMELRIAIFSKKFRDIKWFIFISVTAFLISLVLRCLKSL